MQLLDGVEKAEHAFREQCRGVFVVVREAVVCGQMSSAGTQEQLRARYCLVKLGGSVDLDPLIGVNRVHLEPDALRPRSGKLGGRDATAQQQGSRRTGPGLGRPSSRREQLHRVLLQPFQRDFEAEARRVVRPHEAVANRDSAR